MKISHATSLFVVAIIGGLVGMFTGGALFTTQASGIEVHEVLNVKRLNIIEENGNPAIVIANSESLPAANNHGENPGIRKGVPGIIFYNNFGDEIGGLIYPAREIEGVGYDGGVQLSMDQIKQTGQAIALRHWRTGNYVRSMLEITDYSTEKFAGDMHDDPEVKSLMKKMRAAKTEEEAGELYFKEYLPMIGEKGYLAHRIFLGSEGAENRVAKLEIKDSRSRPRIRIMVDENDQPVIEILDENGSVVKSLKDFN